MKTTVLFGAGAEVGFNLSSGDDFSKKVVGIDANNMDCAIKEFYKGIEDEYFPKVHIEKWKQETLDIASLKKSWISGENSFSGVIDFDKKVKDTIVKLSDNEKKLLRDNFPSYMGILDEQFHTIISPKNLGPNKFWRTVSCYWRAYFCLVDNILGRYISYDEIMCNPKAVYNLMLDKCNEYTNNSYYSLLHNHKDINVITTNYTPLCSAISGILDNDIAYLHGSFKWFEFPKKLEVVDVSSDIVIDFSKHDYFPFVFLQAGIKPIVNAVQIKEWNKAISYLESSDRLIIVGYRANCDDNDINSMIRDFINKGKKVIFLGFGIKDEKDVWAKFLFEKKPKSLDIIKVNNNNSLIKFNEYINL